MLSNANIDISDARYNTNAPFEYACALVVNGTHIPPGMFLSVKINCPEGSVLPFRISSISRNSMFQNTCSVVFSDARGIVIGTWLAHLSENTANDWKGAYILNDNGVLVGHLVYAKQLPGILLGAVDTAENNSVTIDDNDFILMPQCHVAWKAGWMRAINVNGRLTRESVMLKPGTYLHADSFSPYSISIAGEFNERVAVNGICRLIVEAQNGDCVDNDTGQTINYSSQVSNPIWVGGCHLVLRPTVTSNCRIVCNDRTISIKGVLDV